MVSISRILLLPSGLLVALLTSPPSCPTDPAYYWKESHSSGTGISAERPECPQVWDSIPIFYGREGPNGRPRYLPVPSGLAAPGPITDVAEFHDCQRFVDPSGTQFTELFAIFASFKLDSINTAFITDTLSPSARKGRPSKPTRKKSRNGALSATTIALRSRYAANLRNAVAARPSIVSAAAAQVVALHGNPTTSALAAAEIYTYGQGYAPLGIGRNFSCLYLYFDNARNLAAKMVQAADPKAGTPPSKQPCAAVVNPNSSSVAGKLLQVSRSTGWAEADYPAVARWDYDSVNKQYYIGIKCGAAWCEVGLDGVSRFTPSKPPTVSPSATPGERRVLGIKGWHDQQNLALDGPGGAAIPSGIIATVIPAPDLRTIGDAPAYATHAWLLTGYVALDGRKARPGALAAYKAKYNFGATQQGAPLASLNRIYHCFGTPTECQVPGENVVKGCQSTYRDCPTIRRLWVRHASSTPGDPASYRCGIRRQHDINKTGPSVATARWRWIAHDETIWEWCAAAGCCQTGGDLM